MPETNRYIPGACANCDGPNVTARTALFCSPFCRQAAELVRYVRKCRKDGRDRQPDVREAIQLRMAMVLGGGYPEQDRQVGPDLRTEVFRRAGGRCEGCGRELDFDRTTGDLDAIPTIQHVAGNSNELGNLKAFCRRCNMADAQSRFVRVEPGSSQAKMATQLVERWTAPEPLRLCDDENRWASMWRGLERLAREIIREREEEEDAGGDEDLPGFLGWTEQGTPIQDT